MPEYSSPEITELAKALIEVQRDMQPATKDGKNPFTKSNYATLNSVMESCRNALLAHGVWMTQLPVPAPASTGAGHIGLLTKLTHAESGQWQSSLTVVPLPKPDPQGMGSAITYARRYALTAMLGMVTEDDDGESAKIQGKPPCNAKQCANRRQPQKAEQSSQAQEPQFPEAPCQNEFDALPQLEGVNYEIITAQDGRECIIASGNTHSRKEILSGMGFRWNAQRKFWWKYVDAA